MKLDKFTEITFVMMRLLITGIADYVKERKKYTGETDLNKN